MSEMILWGWECEHDDAGQGTFESREEAIEDARDCLCPGQTRIIEVGHIKELEAADYVTVDSDVLLDNAAQQVFNAYGCDEERFFDFVSTEIIPEAVQELHKFMREWSEKYLYNTGGFWVLENTEEVAISKESTEEGDEEGDDEGDEEGDEKGDDDDDYDDSEDDEDPEEEDERDEGKEKN